MSVIRKTISMHFCKFYYTGMIALRNKINLLGDKTQEQCDIYCHFIGMKGLFYTKQLKCSVSDRSKKVVSHII